MVIFPFGKVKIFVLKILISCKSGVISPVATRKNYIARLARRRICDDLQEESAYSSAREARNVILSRGYWADNASLTRYKNLQDEYLYLAEREYDHYEQRWTS